MKFSEWLELREAKDDCYRKVKATYSVFPSAYASGALVQCRKVGAKNWGNKKKMQKEQVEINESKFKLEKERGLKGWFDRNKGKGWIDCKASKKGNLVPCGRKKTGKGTEREYPACRPKLSACNKKGKNQKKSSKRISWDQHLQQALSPLDSQHPSWQFRTAHRSILTLPIKDPPT